MEGLLTRLQKLGPNIFEIHLRKVSSKRNLGTLIWSTTTEIEECNYNNTTKDTHAKNPHKNIKVLYFLDSNTKQRVQIQSPINIGNQKFKHRSGFTIGIESRLVLIL